MSKSIKFSPKHGVNPTIPVCFWCGESKNEVAMLGKLPGDAEAPKYCIVDYEPCDKCKEMMNKGVALICVSQTQPSDGRPPIRRDANVTVYPLGPWMVISKEGAKVIFKDYKDTENCLYVDKPIFEDIARRFSHDEQTDSKD